MKKSKEAITLEVRIVVASREERGGWVSLGCHIFSQGLFPTIGGADNIGFMWLSISVLYFEIKNVFKK